jgi:cytolysin-activating lysine-acyltransferase
MTEPPENAPDSNPTPGVQLADAAFGNLPTLGPVVWLYARTPDRRFLFLSDLDWSVLPPLVLDQCRLFMKGKMPFAFVTWAHVNDDVHQRLLSGNGRLAPHEWKSGEHLWLIDIVTPFGTLPEVLADVRKTRFPDQVLRYLASNPTTWRVEVKLFGGPPGNTADAASTR